MLNTFLFNTTQFNALGDLPAEAAGSSLNFNGYELQTTDVISQILIQDNMPNRDFGTFVVPRGDGEVVTGDFWRRKTIKIKGVIRKTTNSLLEAELDIMKKALAVSEANLDIVIDGNIRRYVATLLNGGDMFSDRKGYHITMCPFNLEFLCLTPFGLSPNYDSSDFLGETLLNFGEQVNNTGTVRARPVVIMNVSAASGVTAISFTNNTRGEAIQLDLAISAGDYVKFDSERLEVSVNGVLKDYTGAFPLLDTGANSFTIAVTGTSITYYLTVKHKTAYL